MSICAIRTSTAAHAGGYRSLLTRGRDWSAKIADYSGPQSRLPFNGCVANKRMTLSRRILLRDVTVLAGLLALGLASLWGLFRLQWKVEVAVDEYEELRLLERAALRVSAARGLVMAEPIDVPAIVHELTMAIQVLEQYEGFQHDVQEGSPSHEEMERSTASSSLADLRSLVQAYAATNASDRDHRGKRLVAISHVLEDLNRLAGEADDLVAKTHTHAAANVRNTIAAIAMLFILITVAGLFISIRQYRDVMVPLRMLREAVRTIASGSFSQRVPETGDSEFLELSRDFNRMAGELDSLYRGLEEKVAIKSRELVQSERLASVGFLAAGVAHEINNPLNIISGYAELSLRRLRRSSDPAALDDAQQSLQIVRDEAFRCKGITEKLLSLSKPGNGTRDALSLRHAAEDVVGMLRHLKRFQDRQLRLQCAEPVDLMVNADENEIKQVLLNLLINAMEATEPGVGQVCVDLARSDGWVCVTVQDNGCGMDAEVCQRVFEPFFTRKRGEGQRGIGLGLSISHAIIASHAGRLHAHSDGPGRGSRFTIELPAYQGGNHG